MLEPSTLVWSFFSLLPLMFICTITTFSGCNGNSDCITCSFCAQWTAIPSCIRESYCSRTPCKAAINLCFEVGCPVITVAHSHVIGFSMAKINGVYPANTVATISCPSPYYIIGSGSLTCSGGSFGTLPTCNRKSFIKDRSDFLVPTYEVFSRMYHYSSDSQHVHYVQSWYRCRKPLCPYH